MAFALPTLAIPPIAHITTPIDPDWQELNQFRGAVETWMNTTLTHLAVYNPNHGWNLALPPVNVHNSTQPNQVQRLGELHDINITLFPIYAQAYAQVAAAIMGGAAAPQVNPAQPPAQPRPPKVKLPEGFNGKSAAKAQHFIRECENYAQITPFIDAVTQIRWALQMLEGDTAHWRDEMLDGYDVVAPAAPPPHLIDWDDFMMVFEARWMDPHEADKALDKIMRGLIIQKTSVKIYNNQFNEAMGLAGLTGANTAIDHAYVIGLKGPVHQAAIAPQMAAPNMTFTKKQALMVRIDEMLMQTQPQTQNTRNTNATPQQGHAQSTFP